MKRFLMATVLAASTLGLATVAMASPSDSSFGKQSAAQYNTDNGQ